MESRLRKLLSPRRHKARRSDVAAELDLHSIPYKTAPSQGRLPVFINQALGKSVADKQREKKVTSDHLRSFSYDEAAPGKPPHLGHRPQRGNGPVKLQTSRRLSSGELLVTDQDYDRTLEEIREGEYVVGGKERRTSRTTSQSNETTNLKFISTAPSSPREQHSFPSTVWQPPSIISDLTPVTSSVSASGLFNSPQRSFSAHTYHPDHPQDLSRHDALSDKPRTQQLYPHMSSTTSLLVPHEEQNPTIQALWKAEYSRLTSIYGQAGQAGGEQTILDSSKGTGSALSRHEPIGRRHRSYSNTSQPSNPSGYLLPSPVRHASGLRTNASTSHLDVSYRDDSSDRSSHPRYSHLSSSGTNSSFTTRTSVTEDSSTTRDDIRKIVEGMRTNYLHAIEAQTPPLSPLHSPSMQKPRSKKQTPSLVSYASVDSSLRSTSRTKSWQSSTTHLSTPRTSISSPVIKSKRPASGTSRRSGQHVAGIATLTPIEASPAKSSKSNRGKKNNDEQGLKRADSTTLGVMARKLTIVDDRNSNGSSQATSKSSPTFYSSSGSDSERGTANTSPEPSPKASPAKSTSSMQRTPEKLKPAMISHHNHSPLSKQPWQVDIDTLLNEDDDLNFAVDIDDFETLCDGLFNSPSAKNDNQLGLFRTWDDLESTLAKDSADLSARPSTSASRRPAELRTSKFADSQLGLGLTGLPSMI